MTGQNVKSGIHGLTFEVDGSRMNFQFNVQVKKSGLWTWKGGYHANGWRGNSTAQEYTQIFG